MEGSKHHIHVGPEGERAVAPVRAVCLGGVPEWVLRLRGGGGARGGRRFLSVPTVLRACVAADQSGDTCETFAAGPLCHAG